MCFDLNHARLISFLARLWTNIDAAQPIFMCYEKTAVQEWTGSGQDELLETEQVGGPCAPPPSSSFSSFFSSLSTTGPPAPCSRDSVLDAAAAASDALSRHAAEFDSVFPSRGSSRFRSSVPAQPALTLRGMLQAAL